VRGGFNPTPAGQHQHQVDKRHDPWTRAAIPQQHAKYVPVESNNDEKTKNGPSSAGSTTTLSSGSGNVYDVDDDDDWGPSFGAGTKNKTNYESQAATSAGGLSSSLSSACASSSPTSSSSAASIAYQNRPIAAVGSGWTSPGQIPALADSIPGLDIRRAQKIFRTMNRHWMNRMSLISCKRCSR
jgi:hypothetical protein